MTSWCWVVVWLLALKWQLSMIFLSAAPTKAQEKKYNLYNVIINSVCLLLFSFGQYNYPGFTVKLVIYISNHWDYAQFTIPVIIWYVIPQYYWIVWSWMSCCQFLVLSIQILIVTYSTMCIVNRIKRREPENEEHGLKVEPAILSVEVLLLDIQPMLACFLAL